MRKERPFELYTVLFELGQERTVVEAVADEVELAVETEVNVPAVCVDVDKLGEDDGVDVDKLLEDVDVDDSFAPHMPLFDTAAPSVDFK